MASRSSTLQTWLDGFVRWAAEQPDISAVALVGSYARGMPKPDSDVDLIVITRNPETYTGDHAWLKLFGQVTSIQDEDWGLVQSRRVSYGPGLEVEFGITTPLWAKTDPVDAGTHRVAADGLEILYDPGGLLAALAKAMN